MLIDEFIDQYTQSEIDKVERKDTVARFMNKLNIQNITTHLADSSVDLSPDRSRNTPTKN